MTTNSMGVLFAGHALILMDRLANLCTTGQFALVAVDSDGHPVAVSPTGTSDSGGANVHDVGSL